MKTDKVDIYDGSDCHIGKMSRSYSTTHVVKGWHCTAIFLKSQMSSKARDRC